MSIKFCIQDPTSGNWIPDPYAQGQGGYVVVVRDFLASKTLQHTQPPTPPIQISSLSDCTAPAPTTPTLEKVTASALNSPSFSQIPQTDSATIPHTLQPTSSLPTSPLHQPEAAPSILEGPTSNVPAYSSYDAGSSSNSSPSGPSSFAQALEQAAIDLSKPINKASPTPARPKEETQPKTTNNLLGNWLVYIS